MFVAIALLLLSSRQAQARAEETASFRTDGASARVYLDGEYVGDTPLDLDVPCNQVTDRQYRIERESCTPAVGTLNARLAGGRVVGAVFTLGISLLVKCPNYFVPVNLTLDCGGYPANRPVATDDLRPRPAPAAPARAAKPSSPSMTQAEIDARLRALDNLRRSGAISAAEYSSRRERLLRQLEH